jgi:3-oxoacyl-[acyl-carrier protein] reductase
MADEPLLGKHALIMGVAASLAEPIALELARLGADVALTTATNDADEAFALRRISRGVVALGRRSMNESVDMSIGTAVQIAMRQVSKEMGGLDIVVVGPDLRIDKPAERFTDADWSRVLNTNLSAVFYACRSAYRELQANGGSIVILRPIFNENREGFGAAYMAVREGVRGLFLGLRAEWRETNVRTQLVRCETEAEAIAGVLKGIGVTL